MKSSTIYHWVLLVTLLAVLLLARPASAEEEEEEEEDHGGELNSPVNVGLKIMSIVVFILAAAIVQAIIIFVPRVLRFPSWLPVHLTSFSAGVIMVVGLCHVFGEGAEFLGNFYTADGVRERYRPGNATLVAGYLFMLFLQKAIAANTHSHAECHEDEECPDVMPESDDSSPNSRSAAKPSQPSEIAAAVPAASNGGVSSPAQKQKDDACPHHGEGFVAQMVLLLTMIGVHAIIEGITLGVQREKSGIVVIFLSILLHNWAEAIVVAAATKRLGFTPCARFLIGIIAGCFCPVGIAIGWGIGDIMTHVQIGHLLCFSAGTFVFISLTDIVPSVMQGKERHATQWLATLFGASAIYAIQIGLYDSAAHDH